MDIYANLLALKESKQKAFAILIDPDDLDENQCAAFVLSHAETPPDFYLVGGSLITKDRLTAVVDAVKSMTSIPVILFPGSYNHLSESADGILFLSLISGRNPDFLIGQQVQAAPLLRQMQLEILSTGYMLIDCGTPTTVSYMSNTTPIPYNKPDIALCTALAAEMLGMKLIYMDAGSGADRPIDPEMIAAVHENLQIPLIIGGGIRTKKAAISAYEAGADLLIIGTATEQNPAFAKEVFEAARSTEAMGH